MTEDMEYSWANTFQDLKSKAEKQGLHETKFATCLKCLEANLPIFNKEKMLEQGKAFGITVLFVPCEKHDGVTV